VAAQPLGKGRRPLRLVHSSDVHLGAYEGSRDPYLGSLAPRAEAAFQALVEMANAAAADALLLAGDLFDHARVSAETVARAAATIDAFRGRVFLLPGNHDSVDETGLHGRHDLAAMADNLHVFRVPAGETVTVAALDLTVWGRAYRDAEPGFRPLDGLPARRDDGWHVALAHGHFLGENAAAGRSLPIEPDEVAAAAGHWDYLAFGHWEPHADVSRGGTTAVYSGSPLPRAGAPDDPGRAVLVEMDGDGVRWRLHPLHGRDDARR